MESNRASFLSSVIFSIFFCFCTVLALGIDTISARGTLRNRETLVSAGGVFELGFFIDPFSGSTYLGIWFKNDKKKKAVWVANRESPLSGYSSSYLQIRDDGNLILMDQRQTPIIVNSAALATSGNTSAILLDSGNFVLRESGKNLVWQSFDYPSDTFLPGMKVGWFVSPTDQSRIQVLVSWASPLSPTRGEFVLGVDYKGATKMGIWRRDRSHMDIGYWDGKSFQFIFQNSSNSFRFTYISNENETYFTFTTTGNYNLSWLVMASTGHIDEYFMSEGNISTVRHSPCNDSAAVNASVCLIPETSGCPEGDLFLATNGSIPALVAVNGSNSMSSSDCEFMCRSNCSCAAFASGIEGDQTWCQLYYGNKNNILGLLEKGGGAVYIRGDYGLKPNRKKRKRLVLILFNVFVPLIVVILALIWCYPKCRNRYATGNQVQCHNETSSVAEAVLLRGNNNAISSNGSTGNRIELGGERDQDLPLFSFSSIEAATDYFANSNKLGEGGFGLVYKAWNLFKEGNCMEFIDPTLANSCSTSEAFRHVQIGLLCVQDRPAERPAMSDVVSMLNSDTMALPYPRKPAILIYASSTDVDSSGNKVVWSRNDVTMSEISAR
ncbi:Non-specific serine/threonine protein kinase [Bertholletia excelsa]